MEPQYWVVGATWGGYEDQLDKFIRRGHWILGWSPKEQPNQARKRDSIRPNDRIAIKRMLGKGSQHIEIRALGIVKEIDEESEDKIVYVNWLVSDLKRRVESKGAYDAIHGPYRETNPWVRKVFHI